MLLALIAILLYGGVLAIVLFRYGTRRPHLGDYPPATSGPLVSVVIPARNEAHNIERCVRSIAASTYTSLEIIVVDDRSTDGTGDVLRRLERAPELSGKLRVVPGSTLSPGWFGKVWAVIQGYSAARGELLLFADADTKHEPELIPRALTALEREGVHLLSVIPRQEVGSFWERVIQPHVFFVLASRVGDLRRVNRTRVPWEAIANGQFILTSRAQYEAVGTHEVVKDQVAEDVALAQAYARAGKDVFLLHAQAFMATRMYRSLGEIFEGWSKNMALGAPMMLPPIRWLRRVAPHVMWVPALVWVLPPVVWALTGWTAAAIATALSLAIWLVTYYYERVNPAYALLYPFAAVVVALIMIRSAWRGAKRVEWKGRVYGR